MTIKIKKDLGMLVIAALSLTTSCSSVSKYDFSNYEIKQKGLKQEIIKRYEEQNKYKTFEEYLIDVDKNRDGKLTYDELGDWMSKNPNNK